jgi:hypothetical protein
MTSAERIQVETLQISTAEDVKAMFPQDSSYDCYLSRPLRSQQPVRLEARVERLLDQTTLVSPLMQRECVKFSSLVYCETQDGIHPDPLAAYSEQVPFEVSLTGRSDLRVEVPSDEVVLFDMKAGHSSCRHVFTSAPRKFQEFLCKSHAGAIQPMPNFALPQPHMLQFHETTLLVGSRVTLFGELSRDSAGKLRLEGWTPPTQKREPWRTSFAQSGTCNGDPISDEESVQQCAALGKVLISDDASLMSFSFRHPCIPVFAFSSLWRRSAWAIRAVLCLVRPFTKRVVSPTSIDGGVCSDGQFNFLPI